MRLISGATSTADAVLQGVDLAGSRVLVTGVSTGIGLETARVLAAHGALVVGTARDLGKARAAIAQVCADAPSRGGFELIELDLASLASVRACGDALQKMGKPFDVVIANAGVMAAPKGVTADGFETQFGTNHLGHFVLVNRTASLFKPGGRLVIVSSAGHRGADVDLDDPNFERTPYDPLTAYRQSKTATILFAVEFDRRHRAKTIRATASPPRRGADRNHSQADRSTAGGRGSLHLEDRGPGCGHIGLGRVRCSRRRGRRAVLRRLPRCRRG